MDTNDTIDLKEASSCIGVSVATLKNWVKAGYLRSLSPEKVALFSKSEVELLRKNIKTGEIPKLNKRANKSALFKTFIPDEYVADKKDVAIIREINAYIEQKKFSVKDALHLLLLNLLIREGMAGIESNGRVTTENPFLAKEIESWNIASRKIDQYLLECPLPLSNDPVGIIYQSLFVECDKSRKGSYYTPSVIVEQIARQYGAEEVNFIDPCCGTGQFLLLFGNYIKSPAHMCGLDIDPAAVKIAKINMFIKYKHLVFEPNIFCLNTLLDRKKITKFTGKFDVVATNPPWGSYFTDAEHEKLASRFTLAVNGESFSYFILQSLRFLKKGGILSFVLPEAFLNVRRHKEIRRFLVEERNIRQIVSLDKLFTNVVSPVIRIDVENNPGNDEPMSAGAYGEMVALDKKRFAANKEYVIDINNTPKDNEIIEKVMRRSHTTLANRAAWALGVVTGNNHKYLLSTKEPGAEPVFTGPNIVPFTPVSPTKFIHFTPKLFQQVAPDWKYRAPEKLIYKFISRKLVFSYDTTGTLTLNSANIVIPKEYPAKIVLGLFNSVLYQFIYSKKIFSLKVLRSTLEALPLPLLNEQENDRMLSLVDRILAGEKAHDELDRYVMMLFGLDDDEISHVLNAARSGAGNAKAENIN